MYIKHGGRKVSKTDAASWRSNVGNVIPKTFTKSKHLIQTHDFSVSKDMINNKHVYNIKWESHPVPALSKSE